MQVSDKKIAMQEGNGRSSKKKNLKQVLATYGHFRSL